MGALSIAREIPSKRPLPILDINYRSRQFALRRKQVSDWMNLESDQIQEVFQDAKAWGEVEEYFAMRLADVEGEGAHQEKEALATHGMLEGSDPFGVSRQTTSVFSRSTEPVPHTCPRCLDAAGVKNVVDDDDWELIVHDALRLYRTHGIGHPTILKLRTIDNHRSIGADHPIFFLRIVGSPYRAGWLSLRGYEDAFESMNWVCDYRLSIGLGAAREICVSVVIDFRLMDGPRASRTQPSGVKSAGKLRSENATSRSATTVINLRSSWGHAHPFLTMERFSSALLYTISTICLGPA